MNQIVCKLSGIYAEVLVRNATPKVYNRNGGRKCKTDDSTTCNFPAEEQANQIQVLEKSISNTLRTFKRLLYANFSHGYTFLTLTFDRKKCDFDLTDSTVCREKFACFWKNLKRGTKENERIDKNVDMRYLGVEEFHEDDSIHYHVLCHIPSEYEHLLKKKWKYGYLDYKHALGNPFNDVPAIANYMQKGIRDPRLNNGKRRYLSSKNLNKPKLFRFYDIGLPSWINESNSRLLYQDNSEYAFQYYQFLTTLTEDDFYAYIESIDAKELQYLVEQMEMIQQLRSIS